MFLLRKTSATAEVLPSGDLSDRPSDGATRTATWGPHVVSLGKGNGGHSGVYAQVEHVCYSFDNN